MKKASKPSTAAKRSSKQPESFFNWWHILSAPYCPNCEQVNAKPDHGLRRAFCPTCTAMLPRVVMTHLDRAIRSDWFIVWWRLSSRLLRTHPSAWRRRIKSEGFTQSLAKAGGSR